MATLDYGKVSVKDLSYSRCGSLHQCARKFQLENKFKLVQGRRQSVTFSFGHAVGMAVQATAEGDSYERMLLRVLMEWDLDLEDVGTLSEQKALKSPWFALEAAERWWEMVHDPKNSDLKGWDVAMVTDPNTGKQIPGVELTFAIDCGDGFTYEGHIDLLVVNKARTKFKVVELKTSGGNMVHEAMYKNSMQAVGYSVVIDKAAETLGISNAYDVQYIVYQTKSQKYTSLPFIKTPQHRTIFLSNLITDINYINMCEEQNYYPRNGSSCFDFFRPCEYFGVCNFSDDRIELMAEKQRASQGAEVFTEAGDSFAMFNFTLDEIMDVQRSNAESLLVDINEEQDNGQD